MAAQWIWYPGDFEFYLGLNVVSARRERDITITPDWPVNTFHPNVQFCRRFEAPQDTCLHIFTTGTLCIRLDGQWYSSYPKDTGLFVKKGSHQLSVLVFSKDVLPALFIDEPCLQTDAEWTASCDNRHWKPVGLWDFSDRLSPPSDFRLASQRVNPAAVRQTPEGVLYDFGKEYMAQVFIEQAEGKGRLHICYGESEEEALDMENCTNFDCLEVDAQTPRQLCGSQAFAMRYLFVRSDPGVRYREVYAASQFLPIKNRGSFFSSDKLFNQIYNISVRTLHLNTREFFLDGIKRDRWVWSGDATQSYLLDFYSFFDIEVCKRTIRFLRGADPVTCHINTIQDYTLYWFISLYDYYLYTGDRGFIHEIYGSAKTLMDSFCLPQTDAQGFLQAQPCDWVFVDWAQIPGLCKGKISFIQLLFAQSLRVMHLLAGLEEDADATQRYLQLFEALRGQLFRTFWSEEKGCFTNGPASDPNAFVTRYTNMFALLFGYLNEEQKQSVIRSVFLNSEVPPITTPYMKFYELLAMCEAGLFSEVASHIRSYWGGMVGLGCTSFWEVYDPQKSGAQHYAMYGKKYGKSLCHAWGAGPILIFAKYGLGVMPVKPGYQEFRVEPHLPDGLDFMEGVVPVPNGDIRVHVSRKKVLVENRTDRVGRLILDGRETIVPAHSSLSVIRQQEAVPAVCRL